MFKACLVRDGEDDEETISCPHVLLPHRTKLLLACCVQYWVHVSTPTISTNSIKAIKLQLYITYVKIVPALLESR